MISDDFQFQGVKSDLIFICMKYQYIGPSGVHTPCNFAFHENEL